MLVKLRNVNSGKENIAIVLENINTLEDVHYLEENILDLILMASDTDINTLQPLNCLLYNVLCLVKSMRPLGDDIQLIERELPIIETGKRI